MIQESKKEIFQKLSKAEGEVRGVVFKTDMEFVLKEKGEKGLSQIEDVLGKIGFPIKYKEIKSMNFYPIGLRVISLLAIKDIFSFNDEKIKEMGFLATKNSLIIKLFVKYFFSTQKVFFKESPKMWEKHYTVSRLLPIEMNEEKKYAILRIEDLVLDPVFCLYLGGYFCGVIQMLVRADKIYFQETKCPFKGGKYHEYLLKWQ